MKYSDKIQIVDGNHLRSSGRDLTVPFIIDIKSGGRIDKLLCTGILRVLPGKRLVCSGKWKGLDVVVKFFLNPADCKRHFGREESGIRALERAGIITPELLFDGVSVSGEIPVLGLKEIAGSRDLKKVWTGAGDDGKRSDILKKLITVIAKQHNAGICHNDPHIKNFLLSGDQIYTIDGDAVESVDKGKELPPETSLKNLGLFFVQFYPEYAGLIRDAFKTYASGRKWAPAETLYESLMKEITAARNKAENEYLKKIFRESTSFVCDKSMQRFMVCDRTYYDDTMTAFLNNPEKFLRGETRLKDGKSSTVFLVRVSGRPLVVKRYNMKNAWHAARRSYRKSRAWASWRNSHLLKISGIRTPAPVAMMEKRLGPFRGVSYILAEYVEGEDIYTLLNSDKALETDLAGLAGQFGEMLRKFSSSLISHGDFKATNFILSGNRLFVTDLDAVCKHRSKRRFEKAFKKDLDRFMQNWRNLPDIAAAFKNEISKIVL
jgi:tRNA A-37 threonylcarbamoyl transferase component Bud32